MRLFISYARVDKRFCTQIVELLEAHEVWFDQRLYVGDKWWEVICDKIDRYDGFIYLLSPDSQNSVFCQKEFKLALNKGKYIFPVLIYPCEGLSPELRALQHVDMQRGLTIDAVKELLNAILVAERSAQFEPAFPQFIPDEPDFEVGDTSPIFHPETFIEEAARAMDDMNYERAIYLLRMAKERCITDDFIPLDRMLRLAEDLLEQQSYEREASRSYNSIVSLVRRPKTRELGCLAFNQFRQRYANYDPEDVAAVCSRMLIPTLDWCDVTRGETSIEYTDRKVTYDVPAFRMSKYPVTNAQFKMFVDAADGYSDVRWWSFSPDAIQWRTYHNTPVKERSHGDHPRVNLAWYEAMAFCNWLSYRTSMKITLPTEQQWQRAAQGDDGRQYPWGNRFDKMLCNSVESRIRTTTDVRRYIKGASAFGVVDLAGNVWEWCLSARSNDKTVQSPSDLLDRVVRGGSYSSQFRHVRNTQRMVIKPGARFTTIGFRVISEG
jgi:hypothetical protein